MTLLGLLGLNALVILGLAAGLWLLSVRLEDVSIVDLFWGPAFGILALVSTLAASRGAPELSLDRAWLLTALTALWGLRLGVHLAKRNLGHGEDRRYQEIRANNDPGFWWKSLFIVFWLQGALVLIIGLPHQVAALRGGPLGLLDGLGALVFFLGLGCEATADRQLARFKARPDSAGKVMDQGLWRYSRHPNYFGDALLWWGLWLISLGSGVVWTVISPLLMTLLLLKVSGVALLEKTITERRPAYRDYIARTSAFIPWPPKPAAAAAAESGQAPANDDAAPAP